MNKIVGVAILTNADRRDYLEQNIKCFLENTSYRPLTIGVFDNGSIDSTAEFCKNLPKIAGIEWRYQRSDVDMGCAPGVNRAIEMVKDCEFHLFLESDWTLLHESESGIGRDWLNECLDFMDHGKKCSYLYLRRFRHNGEAAFHHIHHVWAKSGVMEDKFLHIPPGAFMFSNNPSIRHTATLLKDGVLPLKEFYDASGTGIEKKGHEVWGKAEHMAKTPNLFYWYYPGIFTHESTPTPMPEQLRVVGCEKYGNGSGLSTCKYGFLEFPNHGFCALCDFSKDHHDLLNHMQRFHHYFETMLQMRRQIMPTVGDMEFNTGNCRIERAFSPAVSRVNHIEERRKAIQREKEQNGSK